MSRTRKPQIEGWIRQLNDERLEIFLKVERREGQADRKIRASGPTNDMVELVEAFEEKTGLQVNSPVLPRRVKKPLPGQESFDLQNISELQSNESDAA